jgi:hypothetical protein
VRQVLGFVPSRDADQRAMHGHVRHPVHTYARPPLLLFLKTMTVGSTQRCVKT